jgi:threonine dehydrogenase-like Zn-dependent dehydrogenase
MKPAAEDLRTAKAHAAAGSMRALVFDGSEVRLRSDTPRPQPVEGEALVRTVKAGVSGTDIVLARDVLGFRGTLGHEFVGVVEAVAGKAGADLKGQRVVGSITVICRTCDMCVAGLSSHCRARSLLGMLDRDGCLADYLALPVTNLMRVPDDVDDDHAVFAQSLASAIQASKQVVIEGKPYVTVIGGGSLGHLCAQLMARRNASVRLIGTDAESLALCEKWGVKHRLIGDIGRRADQDVVVVCSESPTALELALKLVRPRGKVVLKALPTNLGRAEGIDLTPIALNEIEMIGSHTGPLSEALTLLSRAEVDVVSLISKRMNLSDGAALIRTAAQPGVIKVLVDV